MNNNRPRIAASQVGASGTLLRSENNNSNISNTSSGKEGIVQKLQGVLFAVRRDRDREYRSRDIAMEKLRSAKEVFQAETSNFGEQKEKLTKTQEEAEKTQKEILRKETTIQELQQRVRKARRVANTRSRSVIRCISHLFMCFLTLLLNGAPTDVSLSTDTSTKI
jgi:predicted Holliday junction resolvase-like endonuclease